GRRTSFRSASGPLASLLRRPGQPAQRYSCTQETAHGGERLRWQRKRRSLPLSCSLRTTTSPPSDYGEAALNALHPIGSAHSPPKDDGLCESDWVPEGTIP